MSRSLVIRFPQSSSPNLKRALKLARELELFRPASEKNHFNTVSLRAEGLRASITTAAQLWELVRSWKGSEIQLDGKSLELAQFRDLVNVLSCSLAYDTAADQTEHCNGFDGEVGWGCRHLESVRLILPAYLTYSSSRRQYWYQFGRFSSPSIWSIDKDAILAALTREAESRKIALCPAFQVERIKAALKELPDEIDTTTSKAWEIESIEDPTGATVELRNVGVRPKRRSDSGGFGYTLSLDLDEEDRKSSADEANRFIPTVRFEDIGGVDEILAAIREVVELPLKYPAVFQYLRVRPHKGILLHGPPGCGKTLIAKAIANEVGAHFISVKGPELFNKYFGQSEENLRKVFEEARTLQPAIIFFDEIDAIAQTRSGDESVRGEARFVNQLLTLMDGIEEYGNVRVLASTNRLELLDDAVTRPGRFDYVIEVKRPTSTGCRKIFEIHTRDMPVSLDFNREEFSRKLEGLSGADIAFVAREGAYECLRRSVDVRKLVLADPPMKVDLSSLVVVAMDFEKALRSLRAR